MSNDLDPAPSANQIEKLLLEILSEEFADRLAGKSVSGSSVPVTGLGMDSLDGVNLSLSLEARLGVTFPNEMNPFYTANGLPRSVKEGAKAFHAALFALQDAQK